MENKDCYTITESDVVIRFRQLEPGDKFVFFTENERYIYIKENDELYWSDYPISMLPVGNIHRKVIKVKSGAVEKVSSVVMNIVAEVTEEMTKDSIKDGVRRCFEHIDFIGGFYVDEIGFKLSVVEEDNTEVDGYPIRKDHETKEDKIDPKMFD